MRGGGLAIELDDLNTRLAILAEDFFRCAAVHDDGAGHEPLCHDCKALGEIAPVVSAPNRAVGSNGDGASLGYSVAAEAVSALVTPTDVYDDLDSIGIMKTVFLYEGMGDVGIIARERYGVENLTLSKVVDESWRKSRNKRRPGIDVVPCHVASVEEVAEAVCDAQVAIRAITSTLQDSYTEQEWLCDKKLVHESVRYCNAVLSGSVDPVDIIEDGNRDGICTLMQYLFICLAKGVMLNNAYRFCQNPECRRLFTPREYNRRVDSKYCCEDCQVKAKYLRTFKNGKKNHETSQLLDGQTGTSTIEVEWSTSSIPVKTLRRDQVRLPGDERNATSGSEIKQLLLLQSFLGLSTGHPRTEGILDKLKARETAP